MKHNTSPKYAAPVRRRIILGVLAALMTVLLAVCAGCGGKNGPGNQNGTDVVPATVPPEVRPEFAPYTGPYGATITRAAEYANTVNGYFNGVSRSEYILENPQVRLTYKLSDVDGFTGLGKLENRDGGVYISDTMDSFMKTVDGEIFFSGDTLARANLFDQGFYYYNLHLLDQFFGGGGDSAFSRIDALENDDCYYFRDMTKPVFNADGSYTFTITSVFDPYLCFRLPEGKYVPSDYDGFRVTLKCSSSDANIFYIAGDKTEFSGDAQLDFKVIPDGEFHTYTVPFGNDKDLTKFFKAYRLDVGGSVGEEITVKDFSLVKLKDTVPPFRVDRNYNMYPDKLHENVRFLSSEACSSIASVGTVTKIPAEKVAKLTVVDASGARDSLEGVDWESAYAIAFDIKDAGVFGLILGTDEQYAGKLSAVQENGEYVITQELDWGGAKVKKGGSIYIARRLYTDAGHDFTAFLRETGYERTPLELTIDTGRTRKQNKYTGYDQLTGAYCFSIVGVTDFDTAYNNPLVEHRVTFSAAPEGSDGRTVYVRGETSTDGCLECAVVLDENDALLPIRVEVCKNFAHDGEELYYTDNDSQGYGLSIFPLTVEEGGKNTFTLANLYEQWGNYRLKQVSSIRWHSAYYHLSLGVTETNCLHFYGTGTRLPDHRGLSAPYWSDTKVDVLDSNGNLTGKTKVYDHQPQHSNNGTHIFLHYTDSNGKYNSCENIGMTEIGSGGPDLSDITLKYLSFDGKVYQVYRHVEMPSTDENRAFYEIDYEFLEDVTFKDVAHDLSLYEVVGTYTKFGYLDKNNNCVIDDALGSGKRVIPLGDDHPYFDYFKMAGHKAGAFVEYDVCSNLSFLLDHCEVTLGGKPYTGGFAVVEGEGSASFTLNLTGSATFKKGDRIHISCILMPWGEFQSQNDDNVRMVRVNTLLNPVELDVTGGEPGTDPVVPTVRSTDGRTCEFTVSGGAANVRDLPGYATAEYTGYKRFWERDYNVTLRLEGFTGFGAPKIYEKVGNDWVEYRFASELGYDGYTVTYAPDGSFTYGFTVTMTEARPRTFRVEAG